VAAVNGNDLIFDFHKAKVDYLPKIYLNSSFLFQVMLSDVGSIINQIMQGSFRSILCDPKYNERAQGNETFEVRLRKFHGDKALSAFNVNQLQKW
jgi:hypothetical protein